MNHFEFIILDLMMMHFCLKDNLPVYVVDSLNNDRERNRYTSNKQRHIQCTDGVLWHTMMIVNDG